MSLDLIFGRSGQTVADWERNLARAVSSGVSHISAMASRSSGGRRSGRAAIKGFCGRSARTSNARCTVWRWIVGRGRIPPIRTVELRATGVRVSAQQRLLGRRPYFGFGPGAAWYVDGERAVNHRSTTTWIRGTLRGEKPLMSSERLGPEERARESLYWGCAAPQGSTARPSCGKRVLMSIN